MITWLPAAIASLFSFGLWGLFSKLTVVHVDSRNALVYQTIGVMIIGTLTVATMNFKFDINFKGVGFGVLTGVAYAVGCLFYFIAASKGKVTTVVTLTSLYPLITIFLSLLFLKETIQLKQGLGIVFAIIAIFLMSL